MAPLLLLLLLHGAAASTTLPSCLTANTTWDSRDITSFTPNIPTPELCQKLCIDSPPCQAVTWASSDASPFPLSCYTYSMTNTTEQPCTDCVSGPSTCSCSSQDLQTIPGDCQVCSFEETLPDRSCATDQQPTGKPGLLALGGSGGTKKVEFWSPDETCHLPDLSRYMDSPSVNFIQDTIVACYYGSCDKLEDGAWVKMADTRKERFAQTNEAIGDMMVLIGGTGNSGSTTELVTVNGESVKGFRLSPGRSEHCSVKVSPDTLLVIGGKRTWSLVSEYSGIGGNVTSRELPSLRKGRRSHACGQYMAGETQMLIVAGGYDSRGRPVSSSEVYQYGLPGKQRWRTMADLPLARTASRGATLENLFYVFGGWERNGRKHLDDILVYNSSTNSFTMAGQLTTSRYNLAVTEVPWGAVAQYCGDTPTEQTTVLTKEQKEQYHTCAMIEGLGGSCTTSDQTTGSGSGSGSGSDIGSGSGSVPTL